MSRSPLGLAIGALERADRLVALCLRLTVTLLMAGMTAAVVAQVFSRYVLGFSLFWSEEVARICLVCLVFLGTAALVRDDGHLAVTSLRALLPARLRALVAAAGAGFGLAVGLYLLRGSWLALGREWGQLTPAIRLPMWAVYGTVTLAIALACVWFAAGLARNLMAAATRRNGRAEA